MSTPQKLLIAVGIYIIGFAVMLPFFWISETAGLVAEVAVALLVMPALVWYFERMEKQASDDATQDGQ